MATYFKCYNCHKRFVGKTALQLWGYVTEDSHLWRVTPDEKSHLTCSDCINAYIAAKEKEDAEKLVQTFQQVQTSRVEHARIYGFVPQEGDICVSMQNNAANSPYTLFIYKNGQWEYHNSLQVGLSRYLEGYRCIVPFGRYTGTEEGYYSKRDLEAEAQTRANNEQESIYVIRTGRGIFVRSWGEVNQYHLTESMVMLYTATPAPDPEPTTPEMVTAHYQLTVSDMSDDDVKKIVDKLDELSEGVSIGAVCIYGYFNDRIKAEAASLDVECLAYCKTEIGEGDFNITSLAKWKQEHQPEREELTDIHPNMNKIEREIILTILEDALQADYAVTVHDGGEVVLKKSSNKRDIFAAMYSTDMDRLFFYRDNQRVGWVFLVYGNQECVVSDYADNVVMEALLKNADNLVEKYS